MIKCCIFDLDGTLLDTISTITFYVNKTLAEFGFDPITEDECKYFVGNGPEKLIRRTLASKGCTDEQKVTKVLLKYKSNYDESPLHLTAPYNEIIPLLEELSRRGIKTGVISNKQDEATVPVVRHFFGDLIDAVHGARPHIPLKPAPDAVFEIMKELGVGAQETLYVGDTDVDMKTGRAIGAARTVGVLWGFRGADELLQNGADKIISEPGELLCEVAE